MPAYIVARVDARDPALLKDYQAAVPPILAKYGGKFIARGGSVVTLEGPAEARRVVLMQFPAMSDAEAFYRSAEYAQARKLREGLATIEFIAVEGLQ